MELNLAPASVVRARELTKRRPFLLLAAACFLLGLLAWSAYYFRAAYVERRAVERLQEKVDAMRAVETRMINLRREIAGARQRSYAAHDRDRRTQLLARAFGRLKCAAAETGYLDHRAGSDIGRKAGRRQRSRAREIRDDAPSPSPAANKPTSEPAIDGILVRGLYLFNPRQQEVVVDYFRNLIKSPFLKIDPNNQSRVIKPTTPNITDWAFPYELRLELCARR